MMTAGKCAICGAGPAAKYGLVILGHYICRPCEEAISGLAWDDPRYEFYKSGLKKIWR